MLCCYLLPTNNFGYHKHQCTLATLSHNRSISSFKYGVELALIDLETLYDSCTTHDAFFGNFLADAAAASPLNYDGQGS